MMYIYIYACICIYVLMNGSEFTIKYTTCLAHDSANQVSYIYIYKYDALMHIYIYICMMHICQTYYMYMFTHIYVWYIYTCIIHTLQKRPTKQPYLFEKRPSHIYLKRDPYVWYICMYHTYICMHAYIYTYMYTCKNVKLITCICIHDMRVYIYMFDTYVYMHVHIYMS